MRNTILTTFCFLAIQVSAQEKEQTGFKIKGISSASGSTVVSSYKSSFSDLEKLPPKTNLKENDIADFQKSTGFDTYSGPAVSFNLILVKPIAEGEVSRFIPELRMGLSYQEAQLIDLNYFRMQNFRIDTLESINGRRFFVDSTSIENYNLSYNQHQLMADADYTVSTNPTKRFKLYIGIGASVGISFYASAHASYAKQNQTSLIVGLNKPELSFEREEESTNRPNGEVSFFGRLYSPAGIDFTIGNKNEALKSFHFLLEFRPGINFYTLPELETAFASVASTNMVGLRYDF